MVASKKAVAEKLRDVRKKLFQQAQSLNVQVLALYLAARDPRTPRYARLLVLIIVAYALSPIDLIPDFIPVLGLLDDLLLLPLLIALAIKATPESVLWDCKQRAAVYFAGARPSSRIAGFVVVLIWFSSTVLLVYWMQGAFT